MWWFLIPAAIGLVIGLCDDDDAEQISPLKEKSILELNLERLKLEINSNSGRKIAIIGQPGAGKSSLLKKMTNGKVKPLPIIGSQTDATNWAVDNCCILLSYFENYTFVDVPGYDTNMHPIQMFLSHFPFLSFDGFIFTLSGKIHSSDEAILHKISELNKNVFIVRTFSDGLQAHEKHLILNEITQKLPLSSKNSFVFVSNRTGEGIPNLLDNLKALIK